MSEVGQENLDDLIRGHIPAALQFAVRLTGHRQDAEDVVQEALLRAAKSYDSFRHASSFRTWLARIIINVHRTRSSQRRKTTPLDEGGFVSQQPSAEQHAEAHETNALLLQLVDELPERQREVLVLLTWENHSVAEASEVLGITPQNVYASLSAARTQLKKRLAGRVLPADVRPEV